MAKKTKFVLSLMVVAFFLFMAAVFLMPVKSQAVDLLDCEVTNKSKVLSVLDEGERETFSKILRSVFGVGYPDSMAPLQGGFAQRLYKMLIGDKYYVVRISDASQKDLENEVKSMMAAEKVGLVPKVYFSDTKLGIFIIDYIDDKKLSIEDRANPKTYIEISKLLQKIHSVSSSLSHADTFDYYKFVKEKAGIVDNNLSKEIMRKLSLVKKVLTDYSFRVFCHNDLNPNNILRDDKGFWIIDWEDASIGNPYLDLATVSNFFIYHDKLENLYLRIYFNGKPSDQELANYIIMKQVSLAYYGLDLIKIASNGQKVKDISGEEMKILPRLRDFFVNNKEEFDSQDGLERYLWQLGVVMLKEALVNMNSEEFKNAVRVVS